ncbi:hypothetical protein JW752_05180, partial [Candidatus Peregrinibacteria bacterium]|nr:hypothetical protein [Candidatus Peregrinibacteria bacterium]
MSFREKPLQYQGFRDTILFRENRLVFMDKNPDQERPQRVEAEFLYAGLTNRLSALDQQIAAETDEEKKRRLRDKKKTCREHLDVM